MVEECCKRKRSGEIDCLRFIFSVFILFFHFNLNWDYSFFSYGNIGVDFFFLVSGYLMASSASMFKLGDDLNRVSNQTWKYIIKKVKRFYIYYLSVIVLDSIFRMCIVGHMGIKEIIYSYMKSIPVFTLTFMGVDGAEGGVYVGNTWYLSAMLIACFLLYPLLLKQFNFSTQIVFPVISVYILGYLYYKNNLSAGYLEWCGLAYFGILRAIAWMAMGGCLFKLNCVFNKETLSTSSLKIVRFFLTIIKVLCYFVVVNFAMGNLDDDFHLHALLFLAIGVLLSFSDMCFSVPDCRVTRILGKCSLGIFIYHGFIRNTLKCLFDCVSKYRFFFFIIMTIVICIGLMIFVDLIIKVFSKREII